MTMSSTLAPLLWPGERLGEAVSSLARQSGIGGGVGSRVANGEGARVGFDVVPNPSHPFSAADVLAGIRQWLEAAAHSAGFEIEATQTTYAEIGTTLGDVGPALVTVPKVAEAGSSPGFLAVLRQKRGKLLVIGPDFGLHSVSLESVRAALALPHETRVAERVDSLLAQVRGSPRRRARVRQALLLRMLASAHVRGLFQLRRPPSASLTAELGAAGVWRDLLRLCLAHSGAYVVLVALWWLVGSLALGGRSEPGLLFAWVLLLFTLVPLRMATTWYQGRVAIAVGARLKSRLLFGALSLPPDATRKDGIGSMLGRVIDSEAVESLAVSGGLAGVLSMVELALACSVLGAGVAAGLHISMLLAGVVITVLLAWRYGRLRHAWTRTRTDLTHQAVELMVGHRTRLVQQRPEHWHAGEDTALAGYAADSESMDRAYTVLLAVVPRLWLVAGLGGLAGAFVFRSVNSVGVAVSLGGILLARGALLHLVEGLAALSSATIAWQRVRPLFLAASRPRARGLAEFAVVPTPLPQSVLVDAKEITFGYEGRAEPVLVRTSLQMKSGERVLLEGPSGCGKSSLVSLLCGLRQPNSGLLLIGGLDRHVLGEHGWRRSVVAAPQFHENHVLTGTLAFNLLMGGRWPPEGDDLQRAEVVCRELGLGNLLERMPAGLMQIVGETGWQLSHGEKSRLFIARALLQDPELVVLDESFAALDPENLRLAMQCVLTRAKTVLAVAHP